MLKGKGEATDQSSQSQPEQGKQRKSQPNGRQLRTLRQELQLFAIMCLAPIVVGASAVPCSHKRRRGGELVVSWGFRSSPLQTLAACSWRTLVLSTRRH